MKQIAQFVAGRSDWSFDVVVHVGAGLGGELAAYQRMEVRRTILIEANPELAALLRQRTGGMTGVEVRAVALAEHDGEATLQVFNNARESSLYPPTRLLQLFPNLSPAGSAQVPTVRLERLLREAAADPSIGNLLVLDLAGIALAALDTCALEVLHDFSHIAVLTSALPLYAGTAGEPELLGWLERCGYRQFHENGDTVAPMRELLFVRDDAAVARLRLAGAAAELAALRASCAAQAAELQACRSAADSARDALARLREELAAETEQRAQLVTERARCAELERERMQRVHTLAVSLLTRVGIVPAPDGEAALDATLDAEALLSHCIDTVADAWAAQVRARAQERAALEAGQRAFQELAADRDACAGRERTLQAELQGAASERAALAADSARQAARGDQLGLEMVRAEAQIGMIRDLLLREADF